MSELITIEGLAEVNAILLALPDRISDAVAYKILTDRAKIFQGLARDAAPVGGVDEKGRKKARKGSLKRSIITSRRLSRRQYQMHHKDAMTDIEVYVGPRGKVYAHMQEFGTHHFGPQPFMRIAWSAGKSQALSEFQAACWNEILKALEKEKSRQAKRGR
jgi:HK97 gp10 family phage protein